MDIKATHDVTEERAFPSNVYAWYVVGVLVIAYTVSFIDRTILTLMVEPIRGALQISDFELSLLHGLAFAIFYTVLGIPIARYADSYNRTRLIALGAFVWSVMTALCGVARTFGQMFAARIGVGVGEAALSPAAYSLIADYFPADKLTRALSVYSSAIYIGIGTAMIAGGAIIANVPAVDLPILGYLEPWRVVFLCVGAPGIFVVALMFTIKEPVRTGLMVQKSGEVSKSIPIQEVIRYISERRLALGLLIVGFAVKGMLWNGTFAWIPTLFIRTYGWTAGEIGLWLGICIINFGTLGILTGGYISSRWRANGQLHANLKAGVIACAVMMPSGIVAPLMPLASLSLACYCVFIFFASFAVGCAAASIQEITPNQMRAQMSALYLFANNLFGIGAGPTVVAFFTDMVYQNDMDIKYSMATTAAIVAPIAGIFLYFAMKPYAQDLRNRLG